MDAGCQTSWHSPVPSQCQTTWVKGGYSVRGLTRKCLWYITWGYSKTLSNRFESRHSRHYFLKHQIFWQTAKSAVPFCFLRRQQAPLVFAVKSWALSKEPFADCDYHLTVNQKLFLLLIGSACINPLAIWSICCKNAYRWFGAKAVIVNPVAGR